MRVISGAVALPDDVFERLSELARHERRSMRAQAALILEDALDAGWRIRQLLEATRVPPESLIELLEARLVSGREASTR